VTILVAVTAALALLASPPPASAASDVRTIPGLPVIGVVAGRPPPRYVRLTLDVTIYGVAGHGEIVVDRELGRFVRRFDAGPVSEREGWDGVHPWRADATGMPRIEGNVDEAGAIRAWARMLAPSPGGVPCDCGSRAPVVATDAPTGRIASVTLHVGSDAPRASFGGYRRAGELVVPSVIENVSVNGTWTARVRGVETPSALAPSTFEPPPEPDDAKLNGVTSVALMHGRAAPVIDVVLNGGAPLHFLFDTGGSNAMTPSAARRLGLDLVGLVTVGGGGAGVVNAQFTTVRSVRIGAAELRDQPFAVLDFGGLTGFDGIVGYELLARFSARLDFAKESLELASDPRAFPGTGVSVPMMLDERQPQVDGMLDGIPGAITIDTGSESAAMVHAPFARAHDLAARYHATPVGTPTFGIGGPVRASIARAAELRLGELRISKVLLFLTDATAGAESDPTVAVNLGDLILRRYTLIFDYRGGTIRFDTPQPRG